MTGEPVCRALRHGLVRLVCLGLLMPSTTPADTLGDTRLFFTRDERAGSSPGRDDVDPEAGVGDVDASRIGDGHGGENADTAGRDVADDRVTGAGDAGDGIGHAGSEGVDAGNTGIGTVGIAHPVAVRSSERRPAIEFEALVHVGEQVLVIVGGERCRRAPKGRELHCDRLPRGVDTLALAPGNRPLVITFDSGRQRRAGVGDVIAP